MLTDALLTNRKTIGLDLNAACHNVLMSMSLRRTDNKINIVAPEMFSAVGIVICANTRR